MKKISVANTAVFTIIARNYCAHASLLMESLHAHHPEWKLFVIFIDDLKMDINHAKTINVSNIAVPRLNELSLKYSILEFSTAVKPWVFLDLFGMKFSKVLYFDPDIFIYKSLSELSSYLDQHEIVLTPHISKPYQDSAIPGVRDFLQVGIYNLGFVALKNTSSTNDFVKWWGTQLLDYGFSNTADFQFTDQKWMDFAPAFLGAKIMQADGYNIAYWNLHEYLKANKPVYFIHYSGFSKKSGLISRYQNRFYVTSIDEYSKYYLEYYDKLEEKKQDLSKYYNSYEYPYDVFPGTNIKIGSSLKRIYDYLIKHDVEASKNITSSNYLNFLLDATEASLPNLLYYLNLSQSSINDEFKIYNWNDNYLTKSYLEWFFKYGWSEHDLDQQLVYELAKRLNVQFKANPLQSFNPLRLTVLPIDQFLHSAYKRMLYRTIDEVGLKKNILDYEKGISNKFTLLFKILKSNEYKEKNIIDRKYFIILSICGLLGSPPYLISKYFKKNLNLGQKINRSNQSNFGVNIAGYFTTESGVADSARGLLSAIDSVQIPADIFNIKQDFLRSQNEEVLPRCSTDFRHPINIICANADQTVHIINKVLPDDYLKDRYSIGYWYWESNIFPHSYFEAFSNLQEIWVATSYVHDVISQVSPIPVVKIPPAFSFAKAKPFDFSRYNIKLPSDSVLALQLFDSGSFVERKNPKATFKAFEQAVKKNPKLHLLLKTTAIKDHPEVQEQFKQYQNTIPNLHFIDGYLPQPNVESLIQSCQIYISLHRCEGLGIPLIKAMLAGIPTIATAFGGNTDFMNKSNSYLVDYKKFTLKEDVGPYKNGTIWAEADYEQAGKILLDLSKKPTRTSTDFVTDYFSQKRVAGLINQRLVSVSF